MDKEADTRPRASVATSRIGALVGALLLFAAAAVGWLVWRGGDQAGWIIHSWEVETSLADLLVTLDEAETGQRGYLLTGDATYLAPYHGAAGRAAAELAALAALTADNPAWRQAVAALRGPTAAKLDEMQRTITLFGTGRGAEALALVRGNAGAHLMTVLRRDIAAADLAEERLLAKRRTAAAAGRRWLAAAAIVAVGSAVALAVIWLMRLRSGNARIAEQARELDRIFSLSSDILAVLGFDGRFRRVSPAWQRITGHTQAEALARPFLDFVHPEDREATNGVFARVRESGTAAGVLVNRYRHADGSYRVIAWRGIVLPDERLAYTVGRDVTEERAREAQLRQAQKMEAVGQLTGGIAHDFNNLLTVILGSLDLLMRDLADGPAQLARRAATAMAGARRAAALTHQLLAFSRRQPLAPQPVDANRLVRGMSELLHRTLGEPIAVETVLAAGLWPALVDPNQLESAILNLAVNARDAMPGGGRLTIETANMHLDDAYAAEAVEVTPGQYVMVAVTDTGVGMTEAVRAQVFEPFFTTKPPGEGSGLGLAQVYGFVRQSGGHVTIYSEPGEGTAVKLYLPRLVQPAVPVKEPPAPAVEEAPRGSGETVLVVEDEPGVREFAVGALEELGYRVLAAGTAAEALALLETAPQVDLLFTDIVLPGGTNGRALADAAQQRRPGLAVLFTTGYTRNAIIHHGRLDEGVAFVGKPFTLPTLARSVRATLARSGARAAE